MIAAVLLLALLAADDAAERAWRAGNYQEASRLFAAAVKREPQNANLRVRWGRLFLERFNRADATALFKEALEIQPNHAGALLGLALAAAEDFDERAVSYAQKALAADPKLVEAHELLARLALEDGDTALALKRADMALAISPDATRALAVHAAVDLLAGNASSDWVKRIADRGHALAFAARIFVLNRRYEEGIALYRRAVEANPRLWSAHSELGINLMRLGRDDEARQHLELAFNNKYDDEGTVNTLRLLDSYKNFVFAKTPTTVLKLDRREADALKPYFEAELARAMAAFEKKYAFKLTGPVRVEVYPNHDDFAVRAIGLPGLGALGVTFGDVVAMDSPSSRKRGAFHWASTLWHELSHVYILTMTKHLVPRWFTEGVAVHEETAASPEWGDRLTPTVIRAIKDKKLLAVAQLDRGFVRQSYPGQVVVSYFQAGRLCDYIAETWGEKKLVEMALAFGRRKNTDQVVRETLGIAPGELDQRFFAKLDADTRRVVNGFDEWRKRMQELQAAAGAGRHDDVIRLAPAVRDLYPEYVEESSAYELLAKAYLARGDEAAAAAELERYAKAGGRDPALLKQLAALEEKRGRAKNAIAALRRLNYVDPLDQELHAKLGALLLAAGDAPGAVREYSALLALKPHDEAAARFSLARAYRAAARLEDAKEQLLLALEIAPGYRPAQKMLLELNP